MIIIFKGKCIVFLLRKYGITVCGVLFCFWSYCLIVYIHLCCINRQRQTTTPFSSWFPLSRFGVPCCTTSIRFIVCVTSFDFSSFHYKVLSVYLASTHINKQQQTFSSTHALSSKDRQMPRLYQVSDDPCEGDRNSDVIFLLQTSLTLPWCNQSVLAIVPDLNIFVWSITIFGIISRSALVQYLSIMC